MGGVEKQGKLLKISGEEGLKGVYYPPDDRSRFELIGRKMSQPYSLNRSPRRLCEGVEPEIPPKAGRRPVRRPFNHYTPALTDWWIVPSLELPFFKYSKFFFTWGNDAHDTLKCGLYLAKGLDPMLRSVYPTKKGRRLLMDDSWGWHSFYPAVASGKFTEQLRETVRRLNHPVEILFEGGYVDDPGLFNPDSELRKRDRYRLVVDPADDSIRVGGAKRDAMSLKTLNKVRDWKSFSEVMAWLDSEQFMWCDLFVANTYPIAPGGELPEGCEVRTAAEIYAEWLAVFQEYL